MTAPRPPQRRNGPTAKLDRSRQNTDTANDTADFDFDRSIVDAVDSSIWTALYNGAFRLAVPCSRCGRWLTDGRSKRAHLGPRCAEAVGK